MKYDDAYQSTKIISFTLSGDSFFLKIKDTKISTPSKIKFLKYIKKAHQNLDILKGCSKYISNTLSVCIAVKSFTSNIHLTSEFNKLCRKLKLMKSLRYWIAQPKY